MGLLEKIGRTSTNTIFCQFTNGSVVSVETGDRVDIALKKVVQDHLTTSGNAGVQEKAAPIFNRLPL